MRFFPISWHVFDTSLSFFFYPRKNILIKIHDIVSVTTFVRLLTP